MKAITKDDGYSYSRDRGRELEILDFVSIGGSVFAVCKDGKNIVSKNIEYLEIKEDAR